MSPLRIIVLTIGVLLVSLLAVVVSQSAASGPVNPSPSPSVSAGG